MELGLPSLQEESPSLLETNLRSGRGASAEPDRLREVKFEDTYQKVVYTVTGVGIMSRKSVVYDYWGAIHGWDHYPINEAFNGVLNECNQCLPIHSRGITPTNAD